MSTKNYKLKTGKFGTYFELMGMPLSNKEVLARLHSLMAIEKAIMVRANKAVVKAAKKPKAVGKKTKAQLKAEEHKARLNAKLPAKKEKAAKYPSYMRLMKPSPELAVIVGDKNLPRSQAVTKIWGYIKKHNLQNPKNKRNIICDEKMLAFTKKKEITMFELAGFVGRHLLEVA